MPLFLSDQYNFIHPCNSNKQFGTGAIRTKQFGSDSKAPNPNLDQTVYHLENAHMDGKQPTNL